MLVDIDHEDLNFLVFMLLMDLSCCMFRAERNCMCIFWLNKHDLIKYASLMCKFDCCGGHTKSIMLILC